jgi:hypothetical protein
VCLFLDSAKTVRAKRSKKRSELYYKVLKCWPHARIDRRLQSIFYNHQWAPGFNVSDRNGNEITELEKVPKTPILARGIHVWTKKPTIASLCGSSICSDDVIVKVRCYKRDLVAIGSNGDALYTQVFLSKSEYKKAATKGAK